MTGKLHIDLFLPVNHLLVGIERRTQLLRWPAVEKGTERSRILPDSRCRHYHLYCVSMFDTYDDTLFVGVQFARQTCSLLRDTDEEAAVDVDEAREEVWEVIDALLLSAVTKAARPRTATMEKRILRL